MPKIKWEQDGDNTFTKRFGPLQARITRKWGMTPVPTEYRCTLIYRDDREVGNTTFVVPIDKDLGVDWHDEKIDKIVQKKFDRLIKSHIRGWLK